MEEYGDDARVKVRESFSFEFIENGLSRFDFVAVTNHCSARHETLLKTL